MMQGQSPVFRASETTEEAYKRWHASLPYTESERLLIQVVRAAEEAGVFDDNDLETYVNAHIAHEGGDRQESGHPSGWSMDIYYARAALGRQKAGYDEAMARRTLLPYVGQVVGTLWHRSEGFMARAVIMAIDDTTITCAVTKGHQRCIRVTNAASLLKARAAAQARKRTRP